MIAPPAPRASAVVDPRIGDLGPALLALEDGSIFPGVAFGAPIAAGGDLVVDTSQTAFSGSAFPDKSTDRARAVYRPATAEIFQDAFKKQGLPVKVELADKPPASGSFIQARVLKIDAGSTAGSVAGNVLAGSVLGSNFGAGEATAEVNVRLMSAGATAPTREAPALATVLVPSGGTSPEAGDVAVADEGTWVFPFDEPPAPDADDNKAVAVADEDGETVYDVAFALMWADGTAPVQTDNEAYALASCEGCTAVAVAFQVVLVVGEGAPLAPANIAVAASADCTN